MLQTLYQKDVEPCLWRAIADLYGGMREKVTWQGTLSKEYEVRQGVGQGRILSPLLYKAYMDGPLAALRESGHGIHIGATYMGSPACADDVLLACDRNSAQWMLDIAYDQACNRRFCIQPLKSTVSTGSGTDPSITLGAEILPHNQHITHLGITRNMSDISSLVADRIELARNTVYALMPTGMHGENGLSPVAIHKLIMTFVLPRMLHGLAPVPLKINVMTFSKSYDIKVITLVFRPTKQISWHSASNVMTLISWHWGVDILLKVNFWWRWRKIITIHA